ncbi:hypothetical protein TcasGA2_TC002024 [Tribolium castaneum]|uniref:Uncharacterized protein n=1 Tax=Tribolium castaneum TaxID=7070 RepID=D7GXU9_TRICA|nr:hypothetical protein TcasGA2_TC002024 [Tribolium castaneum]
MNRRLFLVFWRRFIIWGVLELSKVSNIKKKLFYFICYYVVFLSFSIVFRLIVFEKIANESKNW